MSEKNTTTDCKSEIGVTIGLIDSIMSIATVLRDRPLDDEEVQEALKDLTQDRDLRSLLVSVLTGEPKISAKDFRKTGYLMEVNRRFLHPLGLAMYTDDDSDEFGVYDWRFDPEGGAFGSLSEEGDQEKYDNVTRLWDEKAAIRLEQFGWVIQPIGTTLDGND